MPELKLPVCCAPESYCLKLSTAVTAPECCWELLSEVEHCHRCCCRRTRHRLVKPSSTAAQLSPIFAKLFLSHFFSPVVMKIFISLHDNDFQSENESTALDTWRRKCDLAIESAFWPCWTLCAIESKNWVKCQLSQNQTQGKHIWKTRQKLVTAQSQSQSWKTQWNITVTFFNFAQKTKIQILIKENI